MTELFPKLIGFTDRQEDFFTECLAAVLREEQTLAKEFVGIIYGARAEQYLTENVQIEVETQQQFPTNPDSRIDLTLKVGKVTLGVENKLWAPEGDGSNGRSQLEKYLQMTPLPLNFLCFITADYRNISESVQKHPNYLKPEYRTHFMWRDFYKILDKNARKMQSSDLTLELLNLFKHFGFDPPHPNIGDLSFRENKKNFKKFWDLTKQELTKRGWKSFGRGSIAELYVRKGSGTKIDWMWLDPVNIPGSLRVRLNLRQLLQPHKIRNTLEEKKESIHPDMEILSSRVKRSNVTIEVVDVIISLNKLLDKYSDTESINRELAQFVTRVFDAVET